MTSETRRGEASEVCVRCGCDWQSHRPKDGHSYQETGSKGFRRVPSLRSLTEAFGEDAARPLRILLKGETNPVDISPATDTWVRSCFNAPSWREQARHAADWILGNHGIEHIRDRNGNAVCSYSNTGDSYGVTLLFVGENVSIGDYGTWVESYERRRGRLP